METLYRKVRRLEIRAKRQVVDLFSGMYVSAFKGRGIELEDVREYQTGDDVRAISWSKMAQLGRPFVKEFREERDLTVMLLVDISGSLGFGSHYETKRERLAEVGALLALSAIYSHDRVGLVLFSDKVCKEIPPRRGMRHGARLIREILGFKPETDGTSIHNALDSFNRAFKKRCICFLLSDFIDDGYAKTFTYTAKKDDLVAIRVVDPYEESISKLGLTSFQDLETGKMWLVNVDLEVQKRVENSAKKKKEAFDTLAIRAGAGAVTIDTRRSFIERLVVYFKMRKSQRR